MPLMKRKESGIRVTLKKGLEKGKRQQEANKISRHKVIKGEERGQEDADSLKLRFGTALRKVWSRVRKLQ